MLEADSPTINVLCEKHDMQLDVFCSSHKEPCCVKCISRDHSDCPPISSESLENIVKNANPSSYVQELEESLCSVIEIVNILKQDQQQNNENIKKQRQKLESEVKEFKKSMISSLDVLEKKLFESISKSSDRCKNEITESYNELESLTNQCTGIKDNLSNMKQFATDLHMFLGTISLQKKLDAIRCFMSGTEDRLRNCEMKFARDLDIKPFESCIEKFSETHITCKTHNDYRSKLTHAETFPKKSRIVQQSKINAKEWTTISVSGWKSKSLGAKDSEQVYSRTSRVTESTRFSSSTELTLQQKFVTESTDHVNVNGCAILSNGELVFTEYVNKCLVVYQGNGVKSRVIELFDSPWDVCEVANKTVALNFPVRSTIMVIEISSSKGKVMESFSTSAGICTAITFNDPNLIVAIQKVGFQIFDLKGKLVKTIEMKFHDAKYIAFHSSRLFYTDWKKNEVVCCDLEQKIYWKFKRSDLKCPSGVCVDNEDNILDVGTSSGNILKITPDGKSADEILRTEAVFDSPTGIFIEKQKRLVLICFHDNTFAATFQSF
ncbi:Hypothetical predicted protein [Mytilus galloprovincialis]|uniref:B box-type domain-containing protein n=1 Tax=Mytilus galloprovincialis TaxID=29158 RepID=A0A8B6DJQ1_MYTGA|nr:Hypothetical predicted protein [Mytilus galloprovincialis]